MDEISSRHGLREGFGVFIVEVMEGTPAQTAGLKNGDLVVRARGASGDRDAGAPAVHRLVGAGQGRPL